MHIGPREDLIMVLPPLYANRVYNLMTASTTVPLAVFVPVTVFTGSVKSMMFKFPTDEECFIYTQTQTVTNT